MSDKIPEAAFHSQAAKTVAYLRVSIAYQDVRRQRLAILKYVRKHGFRIDDFIEATASGQVPEKRQRLDGLINVLQRGDRLVVSELSRLGRPLAQIVAILGGLARAGVAFVAMKENIRIDTLTELADARLNLESRIEDWLDEDIGVLDLNLLVIGRRVETDFGGIIDPSVSRKRLIWLSWSQSGTRRRGRSPLRSRTMLLGPWISLAMLFQ